MRLSGLASGMDTETIIKDLMKAERMPLDKLTQKKTYLEWQLDDYRSINRTLNDFSNQIFDTVMRNATFNAKTVNVSNSDAVNIKSINATSDFSGTLSISRLAEQATMRSAQLSTDPSYSKQTLKSLNYQGAGEITIKAIGKDGSMPADGVKITFDPETDTIESVLKKINSNTGINAFYDNFTGSISITSKNSGDVKDGPEIELDGDLVSFLKLDSDNITAKTNGRGSEGVNSEFTFNGLTTQRSSNSFEINGFEITLKQVSANPITFSSSPDTDKVVESIKKFVEDYNKLIDDLNKKIREPKYRDYQPLSSEQKTDMKEKEIDLWEEKAKSGTLRNDSIISSMLTKMRDALYSTVEGSKGAIRLSDIGITTSKSYLDNGKLVLDEAKLKEAISSDPNKVYEVFGKVSDNNNEKGLASRVRTIIDDSRKSITAKAGSAGSTNQSFALGRNLKTMIEQIARFEDRLKMVEDRYYKQFTAMETAIQRANAQSAQLMSTFGGGQ